MSRPRGRKFNNQDWAARKAEKQKQWEQRQAEKAKRQAEWAARKAARKAKIEALRKAHQEQAAARKAEREKRKAERVKELAKKRAEIAQRKRERLERQRRELERLSNKSDTFTKRVSFTAINDGKPYLVDENARLLYGIRDAAGDIQHAEGDVVFEDATNPQELLRLGKQKLKEVSKPQVSYEADVVNLGRAGFDPDGVNIGDSVQIIDTTFTPPIRVEGRVLKIEEDLLDSVDATRITLGNIHESYTQKRRAQEQKLDALIAQSDEWNAVADGNSLYVRDLINHVNDVMNGVGGYTYLKPGEGITVYDKPENQHPTRAIQLGGGFWRTSNSRKPNGDWDWKNIASGEGIFANAITTGKLMDAQGRNWWDMDTGEFSLQASAKIGGKTVQQIVDDSADSVISKMNESLTQEAIFNKLTNGGQTQGIYLSGGHVYLNASYLRTGIIRGERGKWDLNNGIISMWDADMHETVHLDGNGRRNTLIGAFRTSLPGNYGVSITPDFDTTQIGDDYYHGLGAGITFTMPNHDYDAVVATEGESNDGKTLSSLWATNGRVNKHDPGCAFTLKEAEDDGKYALVHLVAHADYDDKYNTVSSGVRATSYPNRHSGAGNARLFSANGREECFVSVDVTDGEICFNGALGEESNRNTFVAYHWLAEKGGMDSRQHDIFDFETGCPAKYGCYYAVASSDTDWGAINCHVALTGRASGWKVGLENNLKDECPVDVYINTFGWLVNRNMG